MKRVTVYIFIIFLICLQVKDVFAASYYIDSTRGKDTNSGKSMTSAWKTLEKVSAVNFKPGDKVLFKRGSAFDGVLKLERKTGNAKSPITVMSYGAASAKPPFIKGGVLIGYSRGIVLKDLEVSGKGINVASWGPWKGDEYSYFRIENIHVHDSEGGITFISASENSTFFSDIEISKCTLENIKAYGAISINKWGQNNSVYNKDVRIIDNKIEKTTGAGIQVGKIKKCYIKGNRTDDTGNDPKTGGDGLWTWYCHDLLAEYNIFKGSEGDADACGAHIDMGCRNNIIQYNISIDNEGGFVEILGDCYNSVYRYNISINDGARIKGKNGAHQDGKVFWLNGYTGKGQPFEGPYNSYVYNNTVFVKKDIKAKFKMDATAKGGLFANNVICYEGDVGDVSVGKGKDLILQNNLICGKKIPEKGFTKYSGNWYADPGFKNPGGTKASDYIPSNRKDIVNKSIQLNKLPGDKIGVVGGFMVKKDIFGTPIKGIPDMGAIELK